MEERVSGRTVHLCPFATSCLTSSDPSPKVGGCAKKKTRLRRGCEQLLALKASKCQ